MQFLNDLDLVSIVRNLDGENGLSIREHEMLRTLATNSEMCYEHIMPLTLCIRKIDCAAIQRAIIHALRDGVNKSCIYGECLIVNAGHNELMNIVRECSGCAMDAIYLIGDLIDAASRLVHRLVEDNVHVFLQQTLVRSLPREVINASLFALTRLLHVARSNPQTYEALLQNVDVIAQLEHICSGRIRMSDLDRLRLASLLQMLVTDHRIIQRNHGSRGFDLALQIIRQANPNRCQYLQQLVEQQVQHLRRQQLH